MNNRVQRGKGNEGKEVHVSGNEWFTLGIGRGEEEESEIILLSSWSDNALLHTQLAIFFSR